jgi:hypothetical protein
LRRSHARGARSRFRHDGGLRRRGQHPHLRRADRNGALVAAHELAWGFLDDEEPSAAPRDEIAARLGDELAELFKTSSGAGRVTQLCICGGLPELRSTTLPLMERFDVEVEILDSLSGSTWESVTAGRRIP